MPMEAKPELRRVIGPSLDLSAIGLSLLCVLHCLAVPAFALFLPTLGALADAEWIHLALLAVATSIALIVFVDPRARAPHHRWMLVLAVAGLGVMIAGALGVPHPSWDRPLTLVGGAVLAGAHLANWRRLHAMSHAAPSRLVR